jgi:hypothetical protein
MGSAPSSPPTTPIHVQQAEIEIWGSNYTPAPKRKAEESTKADHVHKNETVRDVFVDSPLSETTSPVDQDRAMRDHVWCIGLAICYQIID